MTVKGKSADRRSVDALREEMRHNWHLRKPAFLAILITLIANIIGFSWMISTRLATIEATFNQLHHTNMEVSRKLDKLDVHIELLRAMEISMAQRVAKVEERTEIDHKALTRMQITLDNR